MTENKEVNFSLWLTLHGVGFRGQSKWTAGELAQNARISRASAYAYATGTRVPTKDVIARIAKVLGVAPADVPVFAQKASKRAEIAQALQGA